MSKTPARVTTAGRYLPEHDRGGTPTMIVCAALALALLVLVVRIAAIW
jgi:preprotein translocase subunit Sec61beta